MRSASAKLGADGHDHELLEVDVVVGVRAAVDDVHQGHGQHVRPRAADIAARGAGRVGGRAARAVAS
jgi:hypothetical protein